MSYYMGDCLNGAPKSAQNEPQNGSNFGSKMTLKRPKMGSREQAQAWPHFTSKIKRFPLVLNETRQT